MGKCWPILNDGKNKKPNEKKNWVTEQGLLAIPEPLWREKEGTQPSYEAKASRSQGQAQSCSLQGWKLGWWPTDRTLVRPWAQSSALQKRYLTQSSQTPNRQCFPYVHLKDRFTTGQSLQGGTCGPELTHPGPFSSQEAHTVRQGLGFSWKGVWMWIHPRIGFHLQRSLITLWRHCRLGGA